MRESRTRPASPNSTILRSAGSNASSSRQTTASGPAKNARAFVGPRPNWSLCSRTIAFEIAWSTDAPRSASCAMTTALRLPLRPGANKAEEEERTSQAGLLSQPSGRPPNSERKPHLRAVDVRHAPRRGEGVDELQAEPAASVGSRRPANDRSVRAGVADLEPYGGRSRAGTDADRRAGRLA